ncbi:MAG: nucleotidyltransferase domain-containing protein [Roseiflexaceae bacterium]|nr:nucleotidyltransferase domain-containing protein [Roseiflexus sp.]MDW8213776.1 nucleotidyltransferase domain-containing protein [Roseiflexaceae bacterium]
MIPFKTIEAISDRIAQEFEPELIILFGSYAYGNPQEDSDVDLLVVMRHDGNNVYKAIDILNRVQPPFPIDLLVRSPEEFWQRIALNDSFLCDILAKGRILYASAHSRVDQQSRG